MEPTVQVHGMGCTVDLNDLQCSLCSSIDLSMVSQWLLMYPIHVHYVVSEVGK